MESEWKGMGRYSLYIFLNLHQSGSKDFFGFSKRLTMNNTKGDTSKNQQ